MKLISAAVVIAMLGANLPQAPARASFSEGVELESTSETSANVSLADRDRPNLQ